MNDMTFPLLAALSSTDVVQDSAADKKLDELRQLVEDALLPILYESRYIEKNHLERHLEQALEDAAMLCSRPQLLGRAYIGIVCADDMALPIIDSLGQDSDAMKPYGGDPRFRNIWTMRTSMPLQLFHTTEEAYVTAGDLMGRDIVIKDMDDHAEHRRALLPEEYKALIALSEDGIDPRHIVSTLSYFVPLKRQHSSYLIVSPEVFSNDGTGRYLVQCDAVFVFGHVQNEKCISALGDNFNMPVYFVCQNASDVLPVFERVKSKFVGRVVDVISIKDADRLFDEYDGYVDRLTIHDRLMCEMLSFLEDISIKITQNKKLSDSINRDSLLCIKDHGDTGNILERIQKEFSGNNTIFEREKKDFLAVYHNILACALELETLLRETIPMLPSNNGHTRLNAGAMRPNSLWRRIILRALIAQDFALAEKYQTKLTALYPEQAFITELYIQKNRQVSPFPCSIERLRNMPDNSEVLRAKIYFRQELGISEHDCAAIAALLHRHKDADEKYFWAVHLNEVYKQHKSEGKNNEQAFANVLNAFRQAVLAGSEAAAQSFAMYCGGERLFEEVRGIADMGHPMAAFVYHLLCRTRGESAIADRYLKMAAALRHPGALSSMAEECWENRVNGSDVSFDFAEGALKGLDENRIKSSISLYESLQAGIVPGVNVPDIVERLGYFYFCAGQWRKSREALTCLPVTIEGKFALAIMLKYGHGGNISKVRAVNLIKETESTDGFFARAARVVKKRWLAEELAKL